jgi:hypothetical protein
MRESPSDRSMRQTDAAPMTSMARPRKSMAIIRIWRMLEMRSVAAVCSERTRSEMSSA